MLLLLTAVGRSAELPAQSRPRRQMQAHTRSQAQEPPPEFRYAPRVRGVQVAGGHYVLDFNASHKQPEWVFYPLTGAYIAGSEPRSSTFRNGRQGEVASASTDDYKGSGYDRGHLCPAADMKLSKEAMEATFLMWNMSPQEPAFNRGYWARLEAQVSDYMESAIDTLFVATGPVFVGNRGTIGAGRVTVPGFFYKVLYSPRRGGMAFLVPNTKVGGSSHRWQVSIDLVEAVTGIDFFPQLPDECEDRIEAQLDRW